MEFQNKVTVVFRSATDAVDFITQKYGKFVSGHKVNMTMVSRKEIEVLLYSVLALEGFATNLNQRGSIAGLDIYKCHVCSLVNQ